MPRMYTEMKTQKLHIHIQNQINLNTEYIILRKERELKIQHRLNLKCKMIKYIKEKKTEEMPRILGISSNFLDINTT